MAISSNVKHTAMKKRKNTSNEKTDDVAKLNLFSVTDNDKDDSNINSGSNDSLKEEHRPIYHQIDSYSLRPFLVSLLAVWPITYGVLTGMLFMISFAAKNSYNDNSSMFLLCVINLSVLLFGIYIAVSEGKESINDFDIAYGTEGTDATETRKLSLRMSEAGQDKSSVHRSSAKGSLQANLRAYSVAEEITADELSSPEVSSEVKLSDSKPEKQRSNPTAAIICMSCAFIGMFYFGIMLQEHLRNIYVGKGSSFSVLLKGISGFLMIAAVSCLMK